MQTLTTRRACSARRRIQSMTIRVVAHGVDPDAAGQHDGVDRLVGVGQRLGDEREAGAGGDRLAVDATRC